ncbi:MAG TPA: xanthine dehydrogenase family protein molybdopterin-binding subunit, partial [Vicinamibacterales bacterium]|nr:xanthine dehydrogenase family protein molybdopterin-binding subunit [Vicinamibacterales bacterium]
MSHTPQVGARVLRKEDPRLLTGRGRFVADVRIPGALQAAVFRSPHAHARLRQLDASSARDLPGVVGVFAAADIACRGRIPVRLGPKPAQIPGLQPLLATDSVRYVGEPVAVIVAENRYVAEDALELITVDWEPLPAITDAHAAQVPGAPSLHDGAPANLVQRFEVRTGDPEQAMATADVRLRDRFDVQRHTGVPMETRGLLAGFDVGTGMLTLYGPTKAPYFTRRTVADLIDHPEHLVQVVRVDVGGGFGVRGEFYPEDFLVPFAARRLGRPVKWIEDRRENLLASNHSREIDCEIEIACDADGRILALVATAWLDMGAYLRTSAAIPPRTLAQGLSGPYDIPNVHVSSSMLLTNKSPVGTYRGPGRFEGNFFRERLFDMAAKDLRIDPLEFRRRNLVKPSQMPYRVPTIRPVEREEHLDSGDYLAALERCVAEFRWNEKAALQGRLIDGRYHGLGIGCFIEGGAAGPRENVRFEAGRDGRLTLRTGSASVGQGMETVCVQIASDALGFPMDRIDVTHGSTTQIAEGFGAFHSRCVVVGGSAILDAATRFKEAIRAAAARHLRCEPAEVAIGEGLAASRGGRTIGLGELAVLEPGLGADGTFASHLHTYAYGAAAAHVAVDTATGHVELLDYLMVE